jgi:DNA-binding transcriptional LysR family regulator
LSLNTLNWDDLKFFLLVVRDGSLAKAALRLSVTHSTVFRRINSLESDLGVKLFSRAPEGYQLTASGFSILNRVERIAEEIDTLQRFVENGSNSLSGAIRITAPHNFAYIFLPKYIADFRFQYPDIEINLLVANNDLDLSRNEADLAISVTPAPPENLTAHHLFSLNWSAFASHSYVGKHGAPSSLHELLHNHYLVSSYSDLFKLKAYAWVENNIQPSSIVFRCSDLVSMSKAAEAGIGICLLPDDQIKPELIRLFTMPADMISDIWVLMHPDLRGCRRISLFKEYLIKRFKEDPLFLSCKNRSKYQHIAVV